MIKRIIVIAMTIALLLSVYGSKCTPDEMWDKLDVAYYKLELDYLDESDVADDPNDALAGIKSILKKLSLVFAVPAWFVDCVAATRFLATATPSQDYYNLGRRQYRYSKVYGWLVNPNFSRNDLSTGFVRYYSPKWPNSIFSYNMFKGEFVVSGEPIPLPSGG